LDILFKNSFEVNEDITLMLFVSACYSGAIIPIIQRKLSCDNISSGCDFEGIDGARYEHKISVSTSSLGDEVSWAGSDNFFNTLNWVSKRDKCKDKESCGLSDKGILTLLAAGFFRDDHVFWSSFSGKKVIEELISAVTSKADEFLFQHARMAKALGNIAKGNRMAIKALVYVLKNDKNEYSGLTPGDDVYASAVTALGKIAPQGDKETIEELIDVLKNYKSRDVYYFVEDDAHACAATALGKIARQEDKTAIEALIYAIKNDKDKYVQKAARDALHNIVKGDETATKELISTLKDYKGENANAHASVGQSAKIDPKRKGNNN
jgi:HEAT repeat protein